MWKELLSTSGTSNYFEPRFTLWCFNPLPEGKKGMRWIYQDDFLWAHVWCMIMYAHVIRLRCTALHIITALRVLLFWSFCLKHQQSSTKKHLSNRSIPWLNFRRIDLDTLGPLARPDLCWRGAARYTSYGQLLGAAEPRSVESEIHTATWRPGLRRGGLHHLRMNLDQLDQLPRNCQRCFFFLFQKSFFENVWNRYFNISWLFNTFHIPIDLV